jgi:hypothetical protein
MSNPFGYPHGYILRLTASERVVVGQRVEQANQQVRPWRHLDVLGVALHAAEAGEPVKVYLTPMEQPPEGRRELCGFFETPPQAPESDQVIQCPEPQGAGPLFFLVPVPGGAVRVPVCDKHGRVLAEWCAEEGPF